MAGFGGDRYGGSAYGGTTLGLPGLSGNGLSIPGSTAVFYWTTSTGSAAYGQAAYGGALAVNYPSAGIYAVPDGDSGLVTLPLWWAYSKFVTLNRVSQATGKRTPVRGSAPFATGGTSYHNNAMNPKASVSTSGATAGSNTTLRQLTGLTTPSPYVTTAFGLKATAAGAVVVNFTGEPVNAGIPTTFGFWALSTSAPSAIQVAIAWYDANSTSLGTTTYAVDATARTQSLNAWSWCRVDVSSFPAGAVIGVLSYQATGLSAGATFGITGRIWAPTAQFPTGYFDGDYPGASWNGTPGLSYSDLAPMNYALDGECPLDEPVFYELTNPSVPGFKAQTQTVTLPSSGNQVWLTHPSAPFNPIHVEILGPLAPLERDIVQGIYYPLDSVDGFPIVKSQSRRQAKTGTIKFLAVNHEEKARLNRLFADGQPVLVRSPRSYGEGSMWLSLGKTTEDNRAAYQENPFRTITAPFIEVAAPVV